MADDPKVEAPKEPVKAPLTSDEVSALKAKIAEMESELNELRTEAPAEKPAEKLVAKAPGKDEIPRASEATINALVEEIRALRATLAGKDSKQGKVFLAGIWGD